MVRPYIIALLVCCTGYGHAQESFAPYGGILRFQGTFGAGYNTAFKSLNYYIHGNLEYYADDRISVRSDAYVFLNSKTPSDAIEPFAFNHALFTGAEYHFLKGRLDWYAGLQPGIVYAQRQYTNLPADGISPSVPRPQKTAGVAMGLNTGLNYYANRVFHVFVHLHYNTGWFSDNYSVASLNEVRASFGLGFFLRVHKPKMPPTTP